MNWQSGHLHSHVSGFGKWFRILFLAHAVCVILIERNNHGIRCKHKFGPHVFDGCVNESKVQFYVGVIDEVNATKLPIPSILKDESHGLKPMETPNGPLAAQITYELDILRLYSRRKFFVID